MKVLLNLLPEEERSIIRRQNYQRFFLWQAWVFLAAEGFFALLLGGVLLVLMGQDGSLSEELEVGIGATADVSVLRKYEEKFRDANAVADRTVKLSKEHLRWTDSLVRFGAMVPDTITLAKIYSENYRVHVLGNAKSRDDLLVLEDRLAADPCVESVNVPVSNLFSQVDVEFTLDFTVREECLKNGNL